MLLENNLKKILLFVYSNPELYPPTINAANIFSEKGHNVILVGFLSEIPGSIKIHKEIRIINLGLLKLGIHGVFQYLRTIFRLILITKKT